MKKNDILEVTIEDIKFPNIGVCKVGDRTLQVKRSLPGQRLLVKITKKGRTNRADILEVLQPNPNETPPKCSLFGLCGGCAFQNISYPYEATLKDKMIKDIFAPFNIEDKFAPIIPADATESYRNKMEFSFGDDGEAGNLTLGMRKKGSYYEAVNAGQCLLPHPDIGKILDATLEYFTTAKAKFYHRKRETGTLRHLSIRHGHGTGEVLVNLITADNGDYSGYANMLAALPLDLTIVGILHTVNTSVADAIVVDKLNLLHGRDYFFETIGDVKFKIPTFAFFQTNSPMTKSLYNVIADFAGDLEGKTLFDLYCGVGTIGLYLASQAQARGQQVKKILGIEIMPEAIKGAKENAALNNSICQFIAEDVKVAVKELEDKPYIIILDPPREGIVPKAIPTILEFGADKIVYVSCKPTSFVANLPAFVEGGYKVTKAVCVDMFPRTANVEAVFLLERG
ncbi:MAG: 23S rRNA (uracil(1939)-C(5))-methyltransferase RlmD [Defluviitaleaceae bacterium]|nr:23S rRNA (uracil(1939)-C(5))-methyltransferase RlmD [Defluviitaleaceae bacterium]